MQSELIKPPGFQSVDAAIFPDIGPVAAVLAKLETVDVGGRAVLKAKISSWRER
jgi:hypothetical protein